MIIDYCEEFRVSTKIWPSLKTLNLIEESEKTSSKRKDQTKNYCATLPPSVQTIITTTYFSETLEQKYSLMYSVNIRFIYQINLIN